VLSGVFERQIVRTRSVVAVGTEVTAPRRVGVSRGRRTAQRKLSFGEFRAAGRSPSGLRWFNQDRRLTSRSPAPAVQGRASQGYQGALQASALGPAGDKAALGNRTERSCRSGPASSAICQCSCRPRPGGRSQRRTSMLSGFDRPSGQWGDGLELGRSEQLVARRVSSSSPLLQATPTFAV